MDAKNPHRKCGCSCRPECLCTCTCSRHCWCRDKCEGDCHKKPVRNLVVSIDGTSNQFGFDNTNVIELHSRIIKDEPHRPQLTFYVSGIGTYVPPSLRSLAYWRQLIANKLDLAIAWNFARQVQDAYRWLVDHYEPGDRIFLFGFSRGAYQVRALAGMIEDMGLVYPGNIRLIPFAYELYTKRFRGKEDLCKHFKKTFSRQDVHFIGVWDTVSSVGIIRGQPLPLTGTADHICHFRHALALDERRVKFMPEYITPDSGDPGQQRRSGNETDIKEVWFAGTHSDMLLNRRGVPLLWMENEASNAGLHLSRREATGGVWDLVELEIEKPIESLKGFFWHLLEFLPLSRSTHNSQDPKETVW
ncbi:hypothetical protein B0H17DRAFT_961596 [Mycena rosella]|uniref:T6SS Phospholipase effector Tle1-like catalytic domain-containing protein n=1 Tax=Mycena rosella TaxID=1033263 RepID=A0AAD7BYA6_MYCRO|nr:hypothetical protein B0H17DRAFT_961596 [Mycena rosella]